MIVMSNKLNKNKYDNGKIYKIFSQSSGLVYIGSTCKTLKERFSGHKSSYKQYKADRGSFCTSFYILEKKDAHIYLVKNFQCNNKQQLLREEGEYIKLYCCVNKYIAGRSDRDRAQDNRYICDCGSDVLKKTIKKHLKSLKHIAYLDNCAKIAETIGAS